MKTIIMTIKPIHLGNIQRGKKTYEIRKTTPKCARPFRVLLCESGSGGQIKAEFTCLRTERIPIRECDAPHKWSPDFLEKCCLSSRELNEYVGNSKEIYCIKIFRMVDYCSTKGYHIRNISEFGLKRPPQSWQYVPEGVGA